MIIKDLYKIVLELLEKTKDYLYPKKTNIVRSAETLSSIKLTTTTISHELKKEEYQEKSNPIKITNNEELEEEVIQESEENSNLMVDPEVNNEGEIEEVEVNNYVNNQNPDITFSQYLVLMVDPEVNNEGEIEEVEVNNYVNNQNPDIMFSQYLVGIDQEQEHEEL